MVKSAIGRIGSTEMDCAGSGDEGADEDTVVCSSKSGGINSAISGSVNKCGAAAIFRFNQ